MAGDSRVIDELFTRDVHGWSPATQVSSAAELAVEFEDREAAFSEICVNVVPLEVGDDQACAEWAATATFSGPLTVDDDTVIEPTGERFTVRGVTIADFDGDRICAFRQYWDEVAFLEHVGMLRG